MALSRHRQALKEAFQEIADKHGAFPKSDADYMEESPFESYCGDCVFYQASEEQEEAQCSIVEGNVKSEGVCQLYIEKPASNSPLSDVTIRPTA